MRRRAAKLLAFVLLVAAFWEDARPSRAFVTGERWPTSSLPVGFNVGTTDAPSGFSAAINAATASWNAVATGDNFRFTSFGSTSRTVANTLAITDVDGHNDWVWDASGTTVGGALAVTIVAVNTTTNQILEADTIFNGSLAWSTTNLNGTYDIQTTAVHEAGHWLNLGHSSLDSAVMFATIGTNELKRGLTADDIAGFQALYAATAAPETGGGTTASPGGTSTSSSGDGGGGNAAGCFIATASYGSALHPAVATLRVFRDRYLLGHAPGRAFVWWYYEWSPPAAAWIADRPLARMATRLTLLPLVGMAALLVHAPWLLLLGLYLVGRFRYFSQRTF
ncbi:MAG: matrixin family metalloprotease [Armatimonadetes bacterium]|nr:matrixin family metalloprotease [Armatimonadota bacterium]